MALSVFDEKAHMPHDDMVAGFLGGSFALWEAIKHMADNYKNINEEWKFYGKESGWTKNIKNGKRTLFMFVPMKNKFEVIFTLGAKAVAAVNDSDLPNSIKKLIPDSQACVCGFGLRFYVEKEADVDAVIKLTAIKDKN